MTETVLVTGAAGTLGRMLGPMLAADGWNVRLADIRGGEERGGEAVIADLRVPDDVRRAVEGVDAIIHAAAWHGVHLREHPPRDFWELNVDGTFNVLEAAADAGVRRFVLSSTMGVYGSSSRPDPDGPAVRVHEALPLRPGDIYGESKVIAERLARFYEQTRGIRAVALRYGMFVPEPFGRYGVRMLYGGVDERDVASANIAALRRLEQPGRFAAYNIFSPLPFTDDDLDPLRTDPMDAVRRHWPDAEDLLGSMGEKLWGPINTVYDISAAQRELSWRPRFSFETFLEGVRAGLTSPDELAPAVR
jgi:UDP-glucose 4-epimerase